MLHTCDLARYPRCLSRFGWPVPLLIALSLASAAAQQVTGQQVAGQQVAGQQVAGQQVAGQDDKPQAQAKPRVWSDDTGRFQVRAALVKVEATNVWLQLEDGRQVKVPLDRLSEKDKQFAHDAAKPNPFAAPGDKAGAGAPDAPAAVSTKTVDSGMVMVYAKTDGGDLLYPGLVIATDDGRAIVMPHHGGLPPVLQAIRPVPITTKIIEALASWDTDDGRKSTPLTPLPAGDGIPQYFSADAANLPAALAISTAEPEPGDEARLVGFEISGKSFTTIAQRVTIRSVLRTLEGKVTEIRLGGLPQRGQKMVVLVDDKGRVLGVIERGPELTCRRPDLATLLDQARFSFDIEPLRGDRNEVVWKVTTTATDPFSRVNQARIRIAGESTGTRTIGAGQPRQEDTTARSIEPQEFDLSPADESSGRWTAEVTLPNLGPVDGYRFKFQFAHRGDETAEWDWHPEQQWIFDVRGYESRMRFAKGPEGDGARAVERLASIPGLNGRSLNLPLFTPVEGGGIQVTDETTVWKGEPARPPEDPPQPKKSEVAAGIEWQTSGGYEWGKVTVGSPLRGFVRDRAPVAYSGDGKWLYVVDATNVLYQVDAATLEPERQLQLGADCKMLTAAKSALIVPQQATSVVWIIDPEQLTVEKIWSLPGLHLVAAAAESNIGAVMRQTDSNRPPNSGFGPMQLEIVDWERGIGLHTVKSTYGGQSTPVSNKLGWMHMQMTRKGDYLYTGMREIHRFRWTGEQLIFEQSSGNQQSGHTTHFVVSDGAEYAAMPTGGGNVKGYGIRVLDGRDLTKTKIEVLTGAYPCAIGFDIKNERIYAPNHGKLQVFNQEGGLLTSLDVPTHDICRALIRPGGGQGLFWDSRSGSMWVFCHTEKN